MNIYNTEMGIKSYFSLACIVLFASLFSFINYAKGSSVQEEIIKRSPLINFFRDNKYDNLIEASQNGHLQDVEYFIERGVDVNNLNPSGRTALIEASKNGHLEVVETLLKNGADTELKGRFLGWLNEKTFDPDFFWRKVFQRTLPHFYKNQYNILVTPLIVATYYRQAQVVNLLLNYQADVSTKGAWGLTPLHWITILSSEDIRHGNFEVAEILAEILLEHGADLKAKDDYGNTPLELAKKIANLKITGQYGQTRSEQAHRAINFFENKNSNQ